MRSEKGMREKELWRAESVRGAGPVASTFVLCAETLGIFWPGRRQRSWRGSSWRPRRVCTGSVPPRRRISLRGPLNPYRPTWRKRTAEVLGRTGLGCCEWRGARRPSSRVISGSPNTAAGSHRRWSPIFDSARGEYALSSGGCSTRLRRAKRATRRAPSHASPSHLSRLSPSHLSR